MSDKRYKQLGNYIELVQERNKGAYITNLMGVSIAKKFIPSIANIIGTDLSNYRIVHPGNFAFCPVTSRNGEKITIARYKGKDDCIISQAYLPFRVIDENELDPDYLMMWVMRPEFDRYARFHSHGSVRELFSWEEMCNVYLPIPNIEEQREIVAEYQAVEQRIENNNRLIKALEDTAQAIYHHTFVENIDPENLPEGWKNGKIGDLVTFLNGYAFKSETYVTDGKYKIITIKGVQEGYLSLDKADTINVFPNKMPGHCKLKVGDILISLTGNVGRTCIVNTENLLLNQRVAIVNPKNHKDKLYVYIMFKQSHLRDSLKAIAGGTAQENLSPVDTLNLDCLIPPRLLLDFYYEKTGAILKHIVFLTQENMVLSGTKNLLLSKLS